MNRQFTITEQPQEIPAGDGAHSLGAAAAELIKSRARLSLEVEKEKEAAEKWKKKFYIELLEVLDGLERVLKQAEAVPEDAKLKNHVRTTASQFAWLLKRRDVVPFETLGQEADHELTEVVGEEYRADCPEGQVIEEVGKGYLYKGQLLRRARVIVSIQKEVPAHD